MAISTALCNSYKQQVLDGVHAAADVYKIALIKAGHGGTFGKANVNYSELGADEVPNGNGYTTGGFTLTGYASGLSGDTASIDWDDAVWTPATISADGAMIYNSSKLNKAVMLIAFADGGAIPVTSTNAAFTVPIPSSGTGQVRLT